MKRDRLPTPAGSGYQPAYDIAPDPWEVGRAGEYTALSIVESLKTRATEVKHDRRARDRIFVECYCKWSDGQIRQSGILDPESRAANWMFVLADGMAITLAVDPLRVLAQRILQNGKKADRSWGIVEKPAGDGDQWLTIGVVLPLADLPAWIRSVESDPKEAV